MVNELRAIRALYSAFPSEVTCQPLVPVTKLADCIRDAAPSVGLPAPAPTTAFPRISTFAKFAYPFVLILQTGCTTPLILTVAVEVICPVRIEAPSITVLSGYLYVVAEPPCSNCRADISWYPWLKLWNPRTIAVVVALVVNVQVFLVCAELTVCDPESTIVPF